MGSLKNPKAKGSRNERRSQVLLETAGYATTKSGGSLGAWDLVGVGPTDFVLCQVKTNAFPGTLEMQILAEFLAPPNCRKLIHRWRDRQRQPDVRVL